MARTENFLFVGRATPEKGLATLVRAARRAGVPLKVAGDGPQLDELRRSSAAGAQYRVPRSCRAGRACRR